MSTVYAIFTLTFSRIEHFLGSAPAASSVATLLPVPPSIALESWSGSIDASSTSDEGSHYTSISDEPLAGSHAATKISLAYQHAQIASSTSDSDDTELAIMTSATARAHLRELTVMRRELEDIRDLLARTASSAPPVVGSAVDTDFENFRALASSLRTQPQ